MRVTGILSQYSRISASDLVMSRSSQGTPRSAATVAITSRAVSHRWQPGRESRVITCAAGRHRAAPAQGTRRGVTAATLACRTPSSITLVARTSGRRRDSNSAT